MTQLGLSAICLFTGVLAFAGCSHTAQNGNAVDANPAAGADAGTIAAEDSGQGTAGSSDGRSLPAWPIGKYISIDEVYARSQANDPEMLLVNVVDPEYYNLGHIAHSLKIPYDQLPARLGELDPTRHIVIYCRRGVRSESAYITLRDNAFPLFWVMEGGIERWLDAKYPTVAD